MGTPTAGRTTTPCSVGIATGDIKENLGAPIVVATLESYRNSLLGVEPDLGRSLVVFERLVSAP